MFLAIKSLGSDGNLRKPVHMKMCNFTLSEPLTIIKSSIFDSFWNLEESLAPELHFHVSTYPFEKICNLTLFGAFYGSIVKFYNFWVCPNYSLHQELQFDGSTSLFMIDCNLTLFGASSAQMSGPITNLIPPKILHFSKIDLK